MAISRAAAAEIPSRTHRPGRALAVLAALPMSMRPRTQTAIIIARLRSKTARIQHRRKNLFRLRRLLHRRIPYNPPPKRWRAHSLKPRLPESESGPTLRAKLLCRPAPDVHRATCGSAEEPCSAHGRKNRARRAVSSCRSCATCHGQRGHTEYAAGTGRTFPVGIPSAQQRIGTESCWRGFVRCGRKNGRPKSTAHYRSADRPRRKIVSQQQRAGADGTGRVCTAAQHLCTAAWHTARTLGMAAAPNAMPNNPALLSATPRNPAQPVGSAGMPNHPNSSQVRNTQAESVQQRSTFVQAPNMAGAQPAADHPASPASPRFGMAGNPSVPHSSTPPIPAQNGAAGKQPAPHSAPARDTAGTGARPQQSGGPQNTPVPGTAGTQRTSIGGRYTQPVQQTTRVSTNGNTQITQQNHVSAQQSGGTVQPSSGVRMDGRSTNREHPTPTTPASPAAPSSNREAGTPPRSTARPDAARPAEQHASQRPIPAQGGSAEKPIPQTGTQASPVSTVSSDRQSRKTAAPAAMSSMTAPAPVSQESRGPQRSPAAESSAKRPAPQERRAGTQPEPQKKEQTLYHRPGTAGIVPTAVGINTEAASAAQKPAAEKAAKKPFVPLTGRTPESIPSHLDLHETSQKTTKRPQENTQEVASDE